MEFNQFDSEMLNFMVICPIETKFGLLEKQLVLA